MLKGNPYEFHFPQCFHRFSKFGQSLMYMGGGYIQKLGLTYNDTLNKLQQLETDGWIDFQTRAVFVEYTLYHPSKNLISCVTFVLEFPTSGKVSHTCDYDYDCD